MKQHPKRIAALAAALVLAAAPLFAQLELKVAAYVPANSPWDLGLKRLAADFDRISGGKVRLVFPQSLKAADESDIIRKMRIGVDGALLTTMGIAELHPDSLALALPSLFRNDAEFDAALAKVEPLIRAKLSDRYVMLTIARGGWVRFFSKAPMTYPEDLGRMRMSVSPNDEKFQRLFQSIGTRTVKGTMPELTLQLSSNAVDAFYLSPVLVASLWSQYRGKVLYMSPFRVAPFIGAVVFTKQAWDKVPAEFRPRLEEATREAARRMAADSAKLEEEAIAGLLKDGLSLSPSPADAEARWSAVYTERRNGLVASMFSEEFLKTLDDAIAPLRQKR
ncbi:MAG: TRAP transporter substrate-binding protein DctP [Spirochaetaceae bacterium]|nr:TRAP transporter substrate-binding protein DctP [Spirochaetaceae bacterium]